jgi:glycosyltransferase involved in cell wall biosynthesis
MMSVRMPRFYILLSTYNGEKFLKDFFDSVLAQDYSFFELIIRDDASTDGTIDILCRYQTSYPNKFYIHSGNIYNMGPANSYRELLRIGLNRVTSVYDDSVYFLYADQDDIWRPDKLRKYAQAVKRNDRGAPLLIHSDLTVVDESLNLVSDSFMKFQGLDPKKNRTFHLGMLNIVVGCTMMINRSLAELCIDQPEAAIMHDWWIALVASLNGKVVYLSEKLVQYRQHDMNVFGVTPLKKIGQVSLKTLWHQSDSDYYKKIARQCLVFNKKFRYKMRSVDRLFFTLLTKMPTISRATSMAYLVFLRLMYRIF